jgi:hypothetical protein
MRTPPGVVRDTNLLPRRRLHRAVFLAAGLYNLGWGLYAFADPQWLFRLARMPLQNHPEVFACLGMVIGLYGILYLEVARHPERSWPVAAVGLAGKILGPLGFAHLLLDLPPGGGHRGYAAMVDGSGLMARCCSHSMGGR